MSYFSTPLSGLNASSSALQSISNNLANLNTDGYKSQSATFSDMFYQNLGTNGSGDPLQTGLGVQVSGTTQNQTTGPIAPTGIPSNMALNGNGYFVIQQANGSPAYTRSGDFTTNNLGQLTTLSGQAVMGYPAVGGVVSTLAPLQPINVGKGATSPARATTNFQTATNLNASAAVGYSWNTPLKLFDSLGAPHQVNVAYTKTGTNSWSYNITTPSADIQGATGTDTTIGSGTLTFDSSGNLLSPAGSTASISMGPLANGAATLNASWNLRDSSGQGLITQTSGASSDSTQNQDGFASGSLTIFSVLPDGTVQASFSNGQDRTIGQVAVANFANVQGLLLNGGGLYQGTAGSGVAVIGTAGTGGRGTITGGSVEQSNVDVATEFAKMIVAQRSYEANAKSITAFDQIEQATLAMKN